ncbi:hypothetical protein A3K86_15745 [Photobacterium jeanii]|uniref:EAL domain-containing protein n=1 Tax=Photobacterium jeanii TaxID=858640 RepID=A0A178K7S0_9GAMM|nr:EAL domain-containing protein [Photobacterium jeanii]OAN13116.1 hypothetical protein A3K86_15745 [Photobacterium jeanii]
MNKILRTVDDLECHLRGTASDGYSFVYKDKVIKSAFQPIITHDGQVFGYEALMRVYDLDGSRFQTEPFFTANDLPINDKINIDRLARVIHLRNFACFFDAGALFLNMSPDALIDNFNNKSGPKLLFPRVKSLGLDCNNIYFELLEHHCEAKDDLFTVIKQMRDKGVKLALDDYGSQASSESRAKSVLPDIIKMDKSLLQEYIAGDTKRLTDAMALAKSIGARVLLEGVEDQLAYITAIELGADYLQGYYFGRPKLLNEFRQPLSTAISS